jgi:DNA-binding NtrC family response regulator
MNPRVMVVDDEPAARLAFRAYLDRTGFEVVEADSLARARQALLHASLDVVLLDVRLPDGNGIDWIGELREVHPGLVVVVVTGHGDVPIAVEAMRRGADQFVTKPVNMAELEAFVRAALERRPAGPRRSASARRGAPPRPSLFFGDSAAAQRLRDLAALAARNDSPVLLQGETGSGKSLLARWIHDHGARAARPFVELSCGILTGELLASELFGHARGAFTSALTDKQGLLDVADGGTLFLDEVSEMGPATQAQFLKVLEEKRYRRLGEVTERKSEFRLVCATNRNLRHETEAGRFRPDLYFRLNVFPIDVPPLRTRPDDLPGFVSHLLATLGAGQSVQPEAVDVLQRYAWPGNVRELRNALERALLLARGDALAPEHFRRLDAFGLRPPEVLKQEREWLLRSAIRNSRGNVAAAAQALGVSRATMYRRLQRLRET